MNTQPEIEIDHSNSVYPDTRPYNRVAPAFLFPSFLVLYWIAFSYLRALNDCTFEYAQSFRECGFN